MFNVPASARQARLRSVPWQPNFQKKQNQENSRSSLPFSFSPCSLIKGTKTVSEMLARRAMRPRLLYSRALMPPSEKDVTSVRTPKQNTEVGERPITQYLEQ